MKRYFALFSVKVLGMDEQNGIYLRVDFQSQHNLDRRDLSERAEITLIQAVRAVEPLPLHRDRDEDHIDPTSRKVFANHVVHYALHSIEEVTVS